MKRLATVALVAAFLLIGSPVSASTKSGHLLPGAENLKMFSFSVIAGLGEVVVPQVVTVNWHVPGTAMVSILSCRETGTADAYETKVTGVGEDHFLRLEVGLLTNQSCQVAIAWVTTDPAAVSAQYYISIEYGRPELVFNGATYAGLSSAEVVAGLEATHEMQRAIDAYRAARNSQ